MAMPFLALALLIVLISAILTHARLRHAEAEAALRESEERLRAIVTAIPIPMAITRLSDDTVLYANEHYSKTFNLPPNSLIGKNLYNHCRPDDRQNFLERLKKEGAVHNFEFQTKKLEGKPFWVVSFHPMTFNGEQAIICVAYDITERKRALKKIQQQKDFLQNIIDSLDHPFYVINTNNYQISVANSATRTLSMQPLTTCYALTRHRSQPCTGTEHPCPLETVKKTQKPVIVEHSHSDENGTLRTVEVRGFPIFDKKGHLSKMIEYSVDITERKRQEEQLRKQYKNIQIQNKQLDAFARQLEEMQQQKLYQLNKAYERFVPHEFLNLLDKQSIIEVQLGDHVEKEITILFSDIREFTAISEKMTPQDNFNFINTYLGQMEPIITQHHGFIDKYIGDAIMALFPTCADDAVRGSIAMLKTLALYNQERQQTDLSPISIGIGLNTGPLMLGTIGGKKRMDGTVISDTVNLASRVEDLTKTYGTALLITEQTYLKLTDPLQYNIRVIDAVKVKGKSEVVTVYEIYDADSPITLTLKNQTRDDFEEGFVLYHWKEFNNARPFFERVLQINKNDLVAQIYLKRCEQFQKDGVPDDWKGVGTLESN
jgi:PAS domain S-box-containing protein